MITSRISKVLFVLMLLALLNTQKSEMFQGAQAAPNPSTYCGALGEYTSWYNYKPVLWVWKNGSGNPNPTYVNVYYKGKLVSNSQEGVQTHSGPQVDQGNGWVGYFISKRWISSHWGWENDNNWDVRGCVQS